MPNAKDLSVEDIALKVLAYGPSGVGKTVFASTFPSPYFFDFDGGMLSLRGKDVEYDTYKMEVKNEVVKVSAWREAQRKLAEFETLSHKGELPFETLVFDSISTLQDFIVKECCLLNNRKEPTLHEWGQVIKELIELFTRLNRLPVHTIVTAHELMEKDELTGTIIIQPLCVGKKLPGQLPMYFDEVYRVHTGEGKDGEPTYLLHTTAGRNFTAKSRLGTLAPVTPASYQAIMETVNGGESD